MVQHPALFHRSGIPVWLCCRWIPLATLLCASHNGYPVLFHRQRGNKVFFHQALQDRKLLAIPCIHYFDAHRLRAHLLQASEIQLHPRTSNVTGPEGAGDAVEDLFLG